MAESEREKKFSEELDALIRKGGSLQNAMAFECHPNEARRHLLSALGGDNDKVEAIIKEIPNFGEEYQAWYSEAQAVIKQVLPDRLADFVSYFDVPKGRKEVSFQNYMIRDYLQGLQITRGYEKTVVVDKSAAIPEFVQQLNILKAARATLTSSLLDLRSVLQADLFDSEIDTADALAKAGYLRAAGAICGVVLEKHLLHVCEAHQVKVTKKNASISDLIQLLKDAGTIGMAQWRFVQSLADIRNLCDHAKGREPTKQELNDLVEGTQKVLKTIF